jgi:hypothetical protein
MNVLWDSMVYFLIAFWFMCLQNSSIATRSIIVTVCGVLLILTVWCIRTSWEEQPPPNADEPKRTTFSFEEDHAKQKSKGFRFKRDTVEPKPAKRPARRRSTLLSDLKTTWKRKIRRDTSKTTVDASINEKEKSFSSST